MDVVSGFALGASTLILLIAGLVTAGFVVLFRRRGDRGIRSSGGGSMRELGKRAGASLVRLDDAVRAGDDELGYATAQFGAEKAKPYADALAEARRQVAEAFRLRQALDDAVTDSEREQREWTLQIIALCEKAETSLAVQDAEFGRLRGLEVNASGTLADVRARIAASSARLESCESTLADLAAHYVPATFSAVSPNPAQAKALLAMATKSADAAEPGISSAGVSSVSGTLLESLQSALRADQLIDAVDRIARDLAAAVAASAALQAKTVADLDEAKGQLADAPDADTGKAIIDAIAGVESALKAADDKNPVADLDLIGDAVAALDLALASARNQQQRLTHARAAYEGSLVSATSQISVARDLIGSRGGSVNARTRLAEAERQLMLAQAAAATNPVEALDAVRRAVMHAQDADALARY